MNSRRRDIYTVVIAVVLISVPCIVWIMNWMQHGQSRVAAVKRARAQRRAWQIEIAGLQNQKSPLVVGRPVPKLTTVPPGVIERCMGETQPFLVVFTTNVYSEPDGGEIRAWKTFLESRAKAKMVVIAGDTESQHALYATQTFGARLQIVRARRQTIALVANPDPQCIVYVDASGIVRAVMAVPNEKRGNKQRLPKFYDDAATGL